MREEHQPVHSAAAGENMRRQFLRRVLGDKGALQAQTAIAERVGQLLKILRQLLKEKGVGAAEDHFDLPRLAMLFRQNAVKPRRTRRLQHFSGHRWRHAAAIVKHPVYGRHADAGGVRQLTERHSLHAE